MTHRSVLAISFALAFCLCACSRSASPDGGPVDPKGTWIGAIDAGGATLRLEVHITSDAAGDLAAEMVSLDQDNVRIPVDSIAVADGEMAFAVARIGGDYRGSLNQQGNVAIGTWTQFGNKLPLTLKKQD